MQWTPSFDMASIPQDVLLEEMRRRLTQKVSEDINRPTSHRPHSAGSQGHNVARQAMVRSLSLGRRRGQPVTILRFLAANPAPQSMAEITSYMQKNGAMGRSFYDHLNALMDVHLVQQTNFNGHRAWTATAEGREFATPH